MLTGRREGLKKWDKDNDIIYGRPLSLLGVVIYSSQEFHFPFCYMQTLPINHIKAAEPRSKSDAKGQLISKCLFCVFNSPKKRTKKIWLYSTKKLRRKIRQKNLSKNSYYLPIFRKNLITDQTICQTNSSNKVTQKIRPWRKWLPLLGKSQTNKQISVLKSSTCPQANGELKNQTWTPPITIPEAIPESLAETN